MRRGQASDDADDSGQEGIELLEMPPPFVQVARRQVDPDACTLVLGAAPVAGLLVGQAPDMRRPAMALKITLSVSQGLASF